VCQSIGDALSCASKAMANRELDQKRRDGRDADHAHNMDRVTVSLPFGVDPYDPHDNILAGTANIRELHDRYGAPRFLAAYNAGPGRYQRHLTTGRALPDQTLAYVATLAPIIEGKPTDGKTVTVARSFVWTNSPLFAARAVSDSSRDRSSNGVHPDRSPGDGAAIDLSALVPQSNRLFAHHASEVRSP
jgi:hypothetical protein